MKTYTKDILVAAFVGVSFSTWAGLYFGSDGYEQGYKQGYKQAQLDDNRDAADIEKTMRGMSVCAWTKVYAAYMGCSGKPTPQARPEIHMPNTWNDGESGDNHK